MWQSVNFIQYVYHLLIIAQADAKYIKQRTDIWSVQNKANLRDMIATIGTVMLLKLDSNCRFSTCMTLQFDGWPLSTIGYLFYAISSFVHHCKTIGEFKQELQSENAQFG